MRNAVDTISRAGCIAPFENFAFAPAVGEVNLKLDARVCRRHRLGLVASQGELDRAAEK